MPSAIAFQTDSGWWAYCPGCGHQSELDLVEWENGHNMLCPTCHWEGACDPERVAANDPQAFFHRVIPSILPNINRIVFHVPRPELKLIQEIVWFSREQELAELWEIVDGLLVPDMPPLEFDIVRR